MQRDLSWLKMRSASFYVRCNHCLRFSFKRWSTFPFNSAQELKYFVGTMSQHEAEELLTENGLHVNGAFLFRKTKGSIVVSLVHERKVHHFTLKLKKLRSSLLKRQSADKLIDNQLKKFHKCHSKKQRSSSQIPCALTSYVTYESTENIFEDAAPPTVAKKKRLSNISSLSYSIAPATPPGISPATIQDDGICNTETQVDIVKEHSEHVQDLPPKCQDRCASTESNIYEDVGLNPALDVRVAPPMWSPTWDANGSDTCISPAPKPFVASAPTEESNDIGDDPPDVIAGTDEWEESDSSDNRRQYRLSVRASLPHASTEST
eukprot:m.865575 g.865575  ORF g.865575 m.865575 type:complete len:320 (+) comp23551_c0_seq8:1580-2539(+)